MNLPLRIIRFTPVTRTENGAQVALQAQFEEEVIGASHAHLAAGSYLIDVPENTTLQVTVNALTS